MAHLKLSMSNVKWDDKGETYCWSVLKYVFKLLKKKITAEYLTKFTNASYENILV